MTLTKRRKPKDRLSEEDCLNIVREYMETEQTNLELAEKYNTSEKNVELIVSRHWKALTNVRETKCLVGDQMNLLNHKGGNYIALKAINNVPGINQDFLDLLSDPDDPVLSEAEMIYCFTYIATGDNYEAIHESGLHVSLMGNKSDKQRHQYQLSCRLRGHYVRRKKNVAAYLQKLKEEQYIPDIIDKTFVQRELLEQLHQLKESNDSPTVRSQILKTVEMIGKSVGAFSDVIKVQEIDPAKALDYLESLSHADAELIESEEILGDSMLEDE